MSQNTENDDGQGWDYPELYFPNVPVSSRSTSSDVSKAGNSSTHNGELPNYQVLAPGASHDHYLHQPTARVQHIHQENSSPHPSSSNMGRKIVHRKNSGFPDQGAARGKGPHKRKVPSVPLMFDTASTSGYHEAGSSLHTPLPGDPCLQKQSNESHHTKCEFPSDYGSIRNIRSRTVVEAETNSLRTHLSNSVNDPSSRSSDQSNSTGLWGRSYLSLPSDGATLGRDSDFFRQQDYSYQNTLTNHSNCPLEIGGCNNDTSNMNHTAENVSSTLTQSVVAASNMVGESSSLRLPFNLRFRLADWIRRNRMSSERWRAQGGVVIRYHSSDYGSGFMAVQDMDMMRLDVDNMSYEELLTLGDRIGTVSTGLSDDLISKTVIESINCSSDLFEDDGTCIICMEEYKNMDDVGTLKVCRHDFHMGCIRKWLSIKNVCPICKASAIDEHKEEK